MKKHRKKSPKKKPLSKQKIIVFWIILILIPIGAVLGLEWSLRQAHYGGNLDLVIDKDMGGKTVQVFNPEVTRRYFHHLDSPPTPTSRYFEAAKPSNLKRVICLGGSSTLGYPYENIGGFPEYLQDQLESRFPDQAIEVLNLGISAVNSFTVLDLMPEVLALDPDVLIVYMGHNEFYGALGVCSTASLGQNRSVIKLLLSLEDFRVFRWMRNVIFKVTGWFSSKPKKGSGHTLMARMVDEEVVVYKSVLYDHAMNHFRANLDDIVDQAKNKSTPVLLLTLASNVKDMRPFHQADNEISHYDQADKLLAQGDSLGALNHYQQARDLDGLRFRASSDVNEIIKEAASQPQVKLLDFEASLMAASPQGIIGGEWMIDHLHLHTDGYFFMAGQVVQALQDQNLLFDRQTWDRAEKVSDEMIRRRSGVSNFEREYAAIGIQKLTKDWPFMGRPLLRNHIRTTDDPLAQSAAKKYKNGTLSWTKCRQWLAGKYAAANQLELAEREYRALLKMSPEHIPSRLQVGRLLMLQNQLDEAERQLAIALKSEPEYAPTLLEIGIVTYKMGKFDTAIKHLQKAIRIHQRRASLSSQQQIEAYYTMADAYYRKGDSATARQLVSQLLEQAPDYEPAKQLLEIIEQ